MGGRLEKVKLKLTSAKVEVESELGKSGIQEGKLDYCFRKASF